MLFTQPLKGQNGYNHGLAKSFLQAALSIGPLKSQRYGVLLLFIKTLRGSFLEFSFSMQANVTGVVGSNLHVSQGKYYL